MRHLSIAARNVGRAQGEEDGVKRYLRLAFNGAAAMSAVLCVATFVIGTGFDRHRIHMGPSVGGWTSPAHIFGAPVPDERIASTPLIWLGLQIAFALIPIWWTIYRRRERDMRFRADARGLCPSCGHDLRAKSDRCPECGTISNTKGAT